MTDISKYKNVSLSKDTYAKIDRLRRAIVPNTIISRRPYQEVFTLIALIVGLKPIENSKAKEEKKN